MSKIAIIGSGTSGMFVAHGAMQAGHDVTVYSDRTADEWLNHSAPTGTAFIYDCNIQLEKNLGLEHWQDDAFHAQGIHLDFQPTAGSPRLEVAGLFESGRGAAIDIRMRVHRWMNDFEAAGGRIEYGAVSMEQLNDISRENDLTMLAAGKGEISRVIERDPQRSVYSKPQRNLCMVLAEGIDQINGDRTDYTPVKFNFFADAGEYFWVPYTHKSGRRCWCVLWEAKAGGYLDRFGDVSSAAEAVDVSREVIKEFAPYEYDYIKNMTALADDEHSWLKGRFPPTVRKAYGTTAAGGMVVPIGDAAILFDPIGGQGGNCAQKNAWHWVQALRESARTGAPFTGEWASNVWEAFWARHGRAAYTFNNILLEPLTETGQTILQYSAQDRMFADAAFFGNFHAPTNFFPWFEDLEAANDKIGQFRRGDAGSPSASVAAAG